MSRCSSRCVPPESDAEGSKSGTEPANRIQLSSFPIKSAEKFMEYSVKMLNGILCYNSNNHFAALV